MESINNIFCCPYCYGDIDEDFRCSNCNITFVYKNGIYYFFNPNFQHWQRVYGIEKYMQRQAGVDIEEAEKLKIYNQYQGYEGEPFKSSSEHLSARANSAMLNYSYEIIEDIIKKDNDLFIVIIGARSFWESYFFARYKKVIAIDICDDTRYIDPEYGKGIVRVVADGMYLPLKPRLACLIFMNATYHHMEDKARALKAWYRILNDRGVVISQGEYFCTPNQKGSLEYMGEYSYTYEDFHDLTNNSDFTASALFPISYSENMQYKKTIDLTGKPDNGIIVLVK